MDLSVLNNHVTRIVCNRTTMFFVGWWFTGATNVDGCAFIIGGLVQLPLQHHHGSVCLTILSQVSNCRLLHFWTHLTTKAFHLWSTLKMKKTHAIDPLDPVEGHFKRLTWQVSSGRPFSYMYLYTPRGSPPWQVPASEAQFNILSDTNTTYSFFANSEHPP